MIDINDYSVVLLCAGIGSRLGKFTKGRPKSLLKINGTSLLIRIISILKKKKIKELSLILGFKSNLIIKELTNLKDIKFNFIKIKDYRYNGHACSWHAFKSHWSTTKKPIILIHADIYFDEKYLNNILKSKKKNIIGIHSNQKIYTNESIMAYCNKKNILESLNYFKNDKSFFGETLGINKVSRETCRKLFLFMDNFLKKDKKKLSWEFMLNYFLKKKSDQFYVLKNQKYIWKNVNYLEDYNYLIKNVTK